MMTVHPMSHSPDRLPLLRRIDMKVTPVKDVRVYEAFDGARYDKKREAEAEQYTNAREVAIRQFLAKYLDISVTLS